MSDDMERHAIRVGILGNINEMLPKAGDSVTCHDMDELEVLVASEMDLTSRGFKEAISSLIHNPQYGQHIRLMHPLHDPESPDRLVKLIKVH